MRPGSAVAALTVIALALAAAPPAAAPKPATPPPVGAYAAAAVTPELQEAAAFAVREQARRERRDLRLLGVERAERQVVAGLNFRMTLRVAQGRESRAARVVVYRPLQGGLQLSAWEWLSGVSVAAPK